MVAGADKPVTKRSAPLPSFLSKSMKISRMVEVLEGLPFDSREQGRIVVDRVTRNYLVHASQPLLAILNKQFTKRWPNVARSDDERVGASRRRGRSKTSPPSLLNDGEASV